jgi:hypothetical protein
MNAPQHQPGFLHGQRIGQPPQAQQPSGLARAIGMVRNLSLQAGALSLIVIAAELVVSSPMKPSEIIGRFHGSIDAADAGKKQDAVAELARKQAQAQAEPPAVAQMETEAFRVQQQALADSLGMQSGIANLADLACMIGAFVPNDRRSDQNGIGDALRSACGVGDQVRQNMVGILKRGGQEGSTLIQRPLPARGGAP